MQTSLMEKESDSHKLYLSKTVENRIDDFRRFFYTNHERRCCMDEKELIRNAYRRMYDGMIAKDEGTLREVLDDSFVLVHMTGMRQPKEEFIKAVLNGTLNYYSAEHENLPVKVSGDARPHPMVFDRHPARGLPFGEDRRTYTDRGGGHPGDKHSEHQQASEESDGSN